MSVDIDISYVSEYDLCDRNHFYIIKGISMVAALISYICVNCFGMLQAQCIQGIATAVFALCSGFGLSESFKRKGSLIHYWENKMIKVWIPSLVITVMASFIFEKNAIAWIADNPIALKGSMLYLIFGGYAAFWIVFQLSEKTASRVLAIFAISMAVFFLLPNSWTIKEAIPAFPMGVMLSQLKWRRMIRECSWKNKLLFFAVVSIVAVGAWLLAKGIPASGIRSLLWALSYTAIGVSLLLGTYYAQVIPVFGVFVPFGITSYGLYLVHAEVLSLLKGKTDWRVYALIIIALCVAAAVLTGLRELLITWNYKLRRRKNPHLKGSMW